MNVVRRGCKAPLFAPHLTRTPFRMHPAMGTSLPVAVDLRDSGLIAAVKDQGQTGSCEGHSSSGATESAFALAGTPLGFTPSEIDIYRGARALERARAVAAGEPLPELQDNGAQTEDVIAYMATFGMRPRSVLQTSDGRNSDCEVETINAEETLTDLEKDAARLIAGAYGIDPSASDAEHLVQTALAARMVVRVDGFVDMVFEDWTPAKAPIPSPNTNDPQGGGHALYIVGYRPGAYVVRNSWSTSWGDGGDCLVSSAWVRASWGLYPWIVRRSS